jgi:Fe(3+) dicitrate transport protein
MKKIFIAIISTFFVFQVYSQEKCQLQGSILNENNQSLSFATIELYSLQDSVYKIFTSDINGYLCITGIPEGKYRIKTTFVGYEPFISEVLALNKGENIILGNIILKATSLQLSEVSIIGNSKNKLPGSGEHICSVKLSKINQPDVNKVLLIVPGVYVRDEEGFGLRPNIGLRGTPVNRSAKITLMEDGILMAPAPYADPSAYYFPTFSRMQGIEVLKGSSQIKHGPYTIGGAINLISTKIPHAFKAYSEVSYGSFGTNQQKIWVGDSKKNFDYVFEINRMGSNGFKELDNGGKTGFDRNDVMAKLRWHTDKDSKIYQAISIKFLRTQEVGNESYLGLTYTDYTSNPLRRYSATQKDILNLNHQHLIINHTIIPIAGLSISTSAYTTNTFRDWARVNSIDGQSLNNILNDPSTHQIPYQIMTGFADGDIIYRSAARTYFSNGIQTNAQYEYNTPVVSHKLQIGVRYHTDQADRWGTNDTYTMTNGTLILTTAGIKGNQENQIRNAKSFSGYLNYDISYKGLTIIPGVRYENINLEILNYGKEDNARIGTDLKTASNSLVVFIPGISFNYEITNDMSVFGGAHKGFSPPGMPSVSSETNQAKEETAINYELGYRYNTKRFNSQIVGFLSDYDNLLGSDQISGGGAGTGDIFNAGKAKIQGLELSADYNLLDHAKYRLPLSIAYTYTDARFSETFINSGGDWGSGQINKADFIPFITPHLLTSSLSMESYTFELTLTCRYIGLTRVKPGQNDIILPAGNSDYVSVNAIGEHLVFDLSANYKLHRNITAFTRLNNITNNKNIVANLPQGYRPGMPFAVFFGVKMDIK